MGADRTGRVSEYAELGRSEGTRDSEGTSAAPVFLAAFVPSLSLVPPDASGVRSALTAEKGNNRLDRIPLNQILRVLRALRGKNTPRSPSQETLRALLS